MAFGEAYHQELLANSLDENPTVVVLDERRYGCNGSCPPYWSPEKYLPQVEELTVSSNIRFLEPSFLTLQNLRVLRLDLPLASLSTARAAELWLRPHAGPKLETLEIWYRYRLCPPVLYLPNLQNFKIETNGTLDLTPLKEPIAGGYGISLRTLTVSSGAVTIPTDILKLPNLTDLTVSATKGLVWSGDAPEPRAASVSRLSLNDFFGREQSVLSALEELLPHLKQLQALDVSRSRVLDWIRLGNILGQYPMSLHSLSLAETGLESISEQVLSLPAVTLENLQRLDLSGNQNIVELPEGILRLPNLKSLDLSGTGIDAASVLQLSESLRELPDLKVKLPAPDQGKPQDATHTPSRPASPTGSASSSTSGSGLPYEWITPIPEVQTPSRSAQPTGSWSSSTFGFELPYESTTPIPEVTYPSSDTYKRLPKSFMAEYPSIVIPSSFSDPPLSRVLPLSAPLSSPAPHSVGQIKPISQNFKYPKDGVESHVTTALGREAEERQGPLESPAATASGSASEGSRPSRFADWKTRLQSAVLKTPAKGGRDRGLGTAPLMNRSSTTAGSGSNSSSTSAPLTPITSPSVVRRASPDSMLSKFTSTSAMERAHFANIIRQIERIETSRDRKLYYEAGWHALGILFKGADGLGSGGVRKYDLKVGTSTAQTLATGAAQSASTPPVTAMFDLLGFAIEASKVLPGAGSALKVAFESIATHGFNRDNKNITKLSIRGVSIDYYCNTVARYLAEGNDPRAHWDESKMQTMKDWYHAGKGKFTGTGAGENMEEMKIRIIATQHVVDLVNAMVSGEIVLPESIYAEDKVLPALQWHWNKYELDSPLPTPDNLLWGFPHNVLPKALTEARAAQRKEKAAKNEQFIDDRIEQRIQQATAALDATMETDHALMQERADGTNKKLAGQDTRIENLEKAYEAVMKENASLKELLDNQRMELDEQKQKFDAQQKSLSAILDLFQNVPTLESVVRQLGVRDTSIEQNAKDLARLDSNLDRHMTEQRTLHTEADERIAAVEEQLQLTQGGSIGGLNAPVELTPLETGDGAPDELQELSDALTDLMPGAFPFAPSQSSGSGSSVVDVDQEESIGTPTVGQITSEHWQRVEAARFDLPAAVQVFEAFLTHATLLEEDQLSPNVRHVEVDAERGTSEFRIRPQGLSLAARSTLGAFRLQPRDPATVWWSVGEYLEHSHAVGQPYSYNRDLFPALTRLNLAHHRNLLVEFLVQRLESANAAPVPNTAGGSGSQ